MKNSTESTSSIHFDNVAAIVFDFDGVVVDSLGAHMMAWEKAVFDLGGKDFDRSQWIHLRNRPTREIAATLSAGLNIDPTELILRKSQNVTQNPGNVCLFQGVREVIDKLHTKSFPFGIASNAPRNYVKSVLKEHELPVEVAFGYEDVSRPKPAPDLFLLTAKTLSVPLADHERTLVLEDSTHGIQSALDAGMIPIGITTQNSAERMRDAGSLMTSPSVADFFRTIGLI